MIKAVVGANWGDEGKGKITDMLAEKADIIVFLVAHSVFKSLPYDDKKIILDFCGIYKK